MAVAPNPSFLGGGADFAPPVCPNPRRPIPIPSLSISLLLLSLPALTPPNPAFFGLIGLGLAILPASVDPGRAFFPDSAATASASASYPNFSARSASSLAFFSAASKSIVSVPSFLAPSLGVLLAPSTLAFRGPPPAVDLRISEEETVRADAGGVFVSELGSVVANGDFGRAVPFPLAPGFRKGVARPPAAGGVAVRDTGGVGRLIDGLSHEEKKSSSASAAGVALESLVPGTAASVMTTSSGNLHLHQHHRHPPHRLMYESTYS